MGTVREASEATNSYIQKAILSGSLNMPIYESKLAYLIGGNKMGFFDAFTNAKVDVDCENAKRSGLYEASSHRQGCEYCIHSAKANSSTGLICTGRSNMTVCANLTCEHFSK
jgi:hypothetical protein